MDENTLLKDADELMATINWARRALIEEDNRIRELGIVNSVLGMCYLTVQFSPLVFLFVIPEVIRFLTLNYYINWTKFLFAASFDSTLTKSLNENVYFYKMTLRPKPINQDNNSTDGGNSNNETNN